MKLFLNYLLLTFCIHNLAFSFDFNEKNVNAVKVENGSISVDGTLDEAVWTKANPFSDFHQKDPHEGALPSEKTEVRILYDESAIYFGARMFRKDISSIIATVTRRDEVQNNEKIIFVLDTYNDNITSYSFSISASGSKVDYFHPNDSEYGRDFTFNPVWEGKANIDSLGWTAEVRIPFSQLRFNDLDEQVWGLNINQYTPSTKEDIYWIMIPKNEAGWCSNFGHIHGIKGIKSSSRIELMPYLSNNLTISPNTSENNPYYKEYDNSFHAGLDLKVGIGPNFTLDGTINPDFGQVEADPANINLSAFEIFYDEKRPFFNEGLNLLKYETRSYFYSRRIGEAPKISNLGLYNEPANSTDILGALKISGRTNDGFSMIGLMGLVNNQTNKFIEPTSNKEMEIETAPLSLFNAFRGLWELDDWGSKSGFFLTYVARDNFNNDETKQISNDFYSKQAITGGWDMTYRFDHGIYEFYSDLGFSYVDGSKRYISRLQTSSSRYYQRPDADYLDFDSTLTNLYGYAATLILRKRQAEHWIWSVKMLSESPGFEINDMGKMTESDKIDLSGTLTYKENTPGSWFQSYNITFYTQGIWNFGFVNTKKLIELQAGITFKDFSNYRFEIEYIPGSLDKMKTRGGAMMKDPNAVEIYTHYESDWSKNFSWRIYSYNFWDDLGGAYYDLSTGFNWKFIGRAILDFSLNYVNNYNRLQYIGRIPFLHSNNMMIEHKIIFSAIKQITFSTPIRIKYSLNPEFSLELYTEPYISSAKFDEFGEFEKSGDVDVNRYKSAENEVRFDANKNEYIIKRKDYTGSVRKPDFEYLSFRSNLVLRWEFLPGSAFYLVWQQNREDFINNFYDINPGNLLDVFNNYSTNIFALKISYWLPV